MQVSFRRYLVLGALGLLLVPLSTKSLTEYRGARVANEICAWVNGRTSGGRLELRVGPQARAILDDLRERRSPVICDREWGLHVDSFFTETAVVLRSAQRPIVGLRIAPGISEPEILGYWTP